MTHWMTERPWRVCSLQDLTVCLHVWRVQRNGLVADAWDLKQGDVIVLQVRARAR
jgi:hypothetical protein